MMLAVVMQEGWDGLALGKALKEKAAAIAQMLPLGMTLDKVTDQAVNITSAVNEFMMKFAVALGVGTKVRDTIPVSLGSEFST